MKQKTKRTGAYETHRLIWRGREITVDYDPRSFSGYAHLQIRVKHCRPLPITETGYRSHFADPADVDHLGGPAAYVEAWLEAMGQTKAWHRIEQGGLQMSFL